MASDSSAGMTRTWPWSLGFTLVFGVLGAAVAYYGVQEPETASVTGGAPKNVASLHPMITRIELPYDDPPIPPGPHRDEFRVACTVCHSPRLVFTQPPLSEKQWQAVVHKMVAVYGAPLSGEDETKIVQYLARVHGK